MSEPMHPFEPEDLGDLREWVRAVRSETPSLSDWLEAQTRLMETLRFPTPKKENLLMRFYHRYPVVSWAFAASLAVFLVAMSINTSGPGSKKAFAAVVEQIRRAQTLAYTTLTEIQGQPPQRIEMFYKEPGRIRQILGSTVSVMDLNLQKGITVIPDASQYVEMDLANLPPEKRQVNLVEEMRKIPSTYSAVLKAREMDGRIVQGFRVQELGFDKVVWVDVQTGDLYRIEGEFANAPGMYVVMSDFRFDVDLDDSLFDLTPPAGYKKLNVQMDATPMGEKDLINLLRYWADHDTAGLFPPTLNPAEMNRLVMEKIKAGTFKSEPKGDKTQEEFMQEVMQQAQMVSRGVMFMIMMKPENDWHYVGEGKRLGDNVPVCWWKPAGASAYRVVYGDLHVEDVAEMPSPTK